MVWPMQASLRRPRRGRLVPLLLVVVTSACGGAPKQSPLSEYVAGIQDAIVSTQPERVPTLVVTWDPGEVELGQCKRIAGQPVVYLHIGKILDSANTVEEARTLIAEVLVHELAHARLTCSDADHAQLPRPTPRVPRGAPTLLKQYAWDEFGVAGRSE
jgi:hypothetical protein